MVRMKSLQLSLIVLALTSTASAEQVRDPETGFGIGSLPPSFVVRPYSQPDGSAFTIANTDWQTGNCLATFLARPAEWRLPKTPNAIRADLVEVARRGLHSDDRMGKLGKISRQGVPGIVFTVDPIGYPAPRLRFLWTMFETAKGRTAVRCFTFADQFQSLRPDFEVITKALDIPR